MKNINILVTLDENYIPQLNVMLYSLLYSNPDCHFKVYLLHSSIPDAALTETRRILAGAGELLPVLAKDIKLDNVPTTNRYPREIYYRIFAARYLPEDVDRVLYLDPDIIVNGSIKELYELNLDDYYFAASSHVGRMLHIYNELRLGMDEDSPYINSGVMLMNLKKLREEQDYQEVLDFVEKKRKLLSLPDQDIISTLYGSKIYPLSTFRYNMTELLYMFHSRQEKSLTIDWIRKHSVFIHYCGRNKPWKPKYIGHLDVFYNETLERMKERSGASEPHIS